MATTKTNPAAADDQAPAITPEAKPEASPDRPDAVKFPHSFGAAGIPRGAQGGFVATAQALLGVDKAKGEKARCRTQNGYIFAAREPSQTLLFPEGHELAGRPRYAWADRGDGVQVGTLVVEAKG